MLKGRIAATLVVVLCCLGISTVASAGVPDTLDYAGTVQKDGQPYDGMVEATFALYDTETGGNKVWSETIDSLDVDQGHFVAELGSKNKFDGVFDGSDLWLQITIEGNALMPRSHVGSVPYARRAGVADQTSYDDSQSGLGVSSAQEAIDELQSKIDSLEKELQTVKSDYAKQTDLDDKADQSALTSLESRVSSNETTLMSKADQSSLNAYAKSSDLTSYYKKSNADMRFAQKSKVSSIDTRVAAVESKTQDMSRRTINGNASVVFKGVNVHVRNGNGVTDGQNNGKGNLIIGYNKKPMSGNDRSGSHNVVLGDKNNYTKSGGVVTGYANKLKAEDGAILGGIQNTATGDGSLVLAGSYNQATGSESAVVAGDSNKATGTETFVAAGSGNSAVTSNGGVVGGSNNSASGTSAVVVGGELNSASGLESAVCGGKNNTASGDYSTATGGSSETVSNSGGTDGNP